MIDRDVGRVFDRAADEAYRRWERLHGDEQYGRSPALEVRGEMTELAEAQRERAVRQREPRRTWWSRFFAFVLGGFRGRR